MSLTYKDAIATVTTLGVIVITYAKLNNFSWPLLSSWRTATLVLLILGLGTCIFIGYNITSLDTVWMKVGAGLGGVAMGIGILGLIFNNKILFMLLSISIVTLWCLTTVHHIIENGA